MEEKKQQPVFRTIVSFEKTYGTRNFIEVALKETEQVDVRTTFFSISKGFTNQQGIKRYKNSLGVEANAEMADFLIDAFQKLKKKATELPAKEPAKEKKKKE